MGEHVLMKQIQGVLCHRDSPCRLWRNNTGEDTRTHVKYGLGVGSADLVGLIVGTGQFVGVEVKTASGRLSTEQKAWLETIRKFGGRAEVMRTTAEAEQFLRGLASERKNS